MRLRGGFILLLGSWLLAGTVAAAAGTLLGLKTSVDPQGTTLLLRLPGPVEFTPSQVGPRLYLVDVAGVTSDQPADAHPVDSPLVSSYRIFSYQGADNRPHMGVELTLKDAADIHSTLVPEGLQIRVQKVGSPAMPVVPAVAPRPVPANAPAPQAGRNASLREVSVVQPEGSTGLEVEILGDNPLTYRTLELSKPDRLVLDLPNTINRIKAKQLEVNTPPLKTVRIAQFRNDPPVARVVMDLDRKVPYQVRVENNGLVVELGGSSSNAALSPADTTPLSEPAVAADADLLGEEESLGVAAEAEEPAVEPVLLASNEPAGIVASAALSTPSARGAEPVRAAPPAALAVSTKSTSEAAIPAMSPSPAAPVSIAEASMTQPVLLAQQAAATSPVMQVQPQVFTGEPISLNLKDVDLKDFFRLMHEVSGLNVVLDPNVSGTVTIVLDEVPWDQAMDIVLKNNGLEARTMGNVVRIARISTLEAEAKAQLAKAQAEEQREQLATPTQTVTRTLSYATAATLVTPLKRFLSARGDIVPDPRTNTLIITDVPSSIAKIDALLGTLDRKTPQVEIEARIVAATRSFARDIGTQLAVSGASGNVILGGAGIVGESPILRGTVPPLFIGTPPDDPGTFANVAQPLSVNFGAVGPTSGLSLVLTSGTRFALDAIITAAESRGLGKLLSRPKIITQNNVEGNVEQGVRIPIQTSINNTITTQYIKVVLRMTVTPQITSEGTIFLKTDIENTTINPGIPRILGQPALNTQAATTQVLVSDGGTVFFGGIIQTENTLNENEVPLLGSIPLVGHLFKRRATSTTTNELLFFITPKITQS